ncbi:hypothetical protein L7F22_000107 [Adiantum nelumboides]|nr:hypothetical protein [Adiantum nelumboides]
MLVLDDDHTWGGDRARTRRHEQSGDHRPGGHAGPCRGGSARVLRVHGRPGGRRGPSRRRHRDRGRPDAGPDPSGGVADRGPPGATGLRRHDPVADDHASRRRPGRRRGDDAGPTHPFGADSGRRDARRHRQPPRCAACRRAPRAGRRTGPPSTRRRRGPAALSPGPPPGAGPDQVSGTISSGQDTVRASRTSGAAGERPPPRCPTTSTHAPAANSARDSGRRRAPRAPRGPGRPPAATERACAGPRRAGRASWTSQRRSVASPTSPGSTAGSDQICSTRSATPRARASRTAAAATAPPVHGARPSTTGPSGSPPGGTRKQRGPAVVDDRRGDVRGVQHEHVGRPGARGRAGAAAYRRDPQAGRPEVTATQDPGEPEDRRAGRHEQHQPGVAPRRLVDRGVDRARARHRGHDGRPGASDARRRRTAGSRSRSRARRSRSSGSAPTGAPARSVRPRRTTARTVLRSTSPVNSALSLRTVSSTSTVLVLPADPSPIPRPSPTGRERDRDEGPDGPAATARTAPVCPGRATAVRTHRAASRPAGRATGVVWGRAPAAGPRHAHPDEELRAQAAAEDLVGDQDAGGVALERLRQRRRGQRPPGGLQQDGTHRLPGADPGQPVVGGGPHREEGGRVGPVTVLVVHRGVGKGRRGRPVRPGTVTGIEPAGTPASAGRPTVQSWSSSR